MLLWLYHPSFHRRKESCVTSLSTSVLGGGEKYDDDGDDDDDDECEYEYESWYGCQ